MRYAVIDANGVVHNVIFLDANAPPYAPPAGMTLRVATDEDEAIAAETVPGYAPPGAVASTSE